ncbi:MAG: 1-acyl-sn-glycerol-3-phosphate acyltransferase, partial [Flavobacteriaceae bacterium]|nr:1-acyl-sn-glycerol-3-phosphate acyltransferase [Flavobacteriaceae bacterium]
ENAPDSFVLPVSINNSWKLQRNRMFPIPMFCRLTFETHPLIKVSDYEPDALVDLVEKTIKSKIG